MTSRTFLPRIATAALFGAVFALGGCSEMYSHDDFLARVKDKSEAEVVKEVGQPASVDKSNPARVTLTYTKRTFSTGSSVKIDNEAIVVLTPAGPDSPPRVTEVLYR